VVTRSAIYMGTPGFDSRPGGLFVPPDKFQYSTLNISQPFSSTVFHSSIYYQFHIRRYVIDVIGNAPLNKLLLLLLGLGVLSFTTFFFYLKMILIAG
jgi:hypothetical protein